MSRSTAAVAERIAEHAVVVGERRIPCVVHGFRRICFAHASPSTDLPSRVLTSSSATVRVAEPVAQALAERRGVVALETTLVAHGLPHPQGVEAALAIEAAVRASGAEPATVGVLDGVVRVGLAREELERIATTKGVAKLNLSNFLRRGRARRPRRLDGGGDDVRRGALRHRRVRDRRDRRRASRRHRDRRRVGRSHGARALPVAVVCAGAKAILDLAKTVELLETLWRSRTRLRHGPLPRVLPPRQRAQRGPPHRHDRRSRARDRSALGARSRDRHRRGQSDSGDVRAAARAVRALAVGIDRGGRSRRRHRSRRDAVPARAHARADRGEERTSNRALLEHNASVAGRLAMALAERRRAASPIS